MYSDYYKYYRCMNCNMCCFRCGAGPGGSAGCHMPGEYLFNVIGPTGFAVMHYGDNLIFVNANLKMHESAS